MTIPASSSSGQTLVAFVMSPVLSAADRRLEITEEREMGTRFGNACGAYARTTPRFVPGIFRPSAAATQHLR